MIIKARYNRILTDSEPKFRKTLAKQNPDEVLYNDVVSNTKWSV
jgi:hypothetical protein